MSSLQKRSSVPLPGDFVTALTIVTMRPTQDMPLPKFSHKRFLYGIVIASLTCVNGFPILFVLDSTSMYMGWVYKEQVE